MGLRKIGWSNDLIVLMTEIKRLMGKDVRAFPKGHTHDFLNWLETTMKNYLASQGPTAIGIGMSLKHAAKIAFIYGGWNVQGAYEKREILWSRFRDRSLGRKINKAVLPTVRKGFRLAGWGLIAVGHYWFPQDIGSVATEKVESRRRFDPHSEHLQFGKGHRKGKNDGGSAHTNSGGSNRDRSAGGEKEDVERIKRVRGMTYLWHQDGEEELELEGDEDSSGTSSEKGGGSENGNEKEKEKEKRKGSSG